MRLILLLLFWLLPCRGELRIMVRYREDGFIDEALDLAVGNQFLLNITARNILAFKVEDSAVLQRIIENPRVEFAEIDSEMTKLVFGGFRDNSPTRDREITPYGIPMVQADQLAELPIVDDNMPICVVDTGMDVGHPDLPTRLEDEVTGTNTESGVWFNDGDGHGTHTAGTIGAIGNNSIGVVGVMNNPNLFRFHIGKGLTNDGSGFESAILEAVQGCIDRGARVVSMSLGGESKTRTAEQFYKDAYNEGILIIAAAGNSGDSGDLYPASYKHVMSVAAVDRNSTRPGFSQCNSQVEISAPGVDILSTVPDGYAVASGTSMACPHVAGVAAEVWSRFPDCSNSQIRNVLLLSSLPIGEVDGCNRGYGTGLVQAKAAYDLLAGEGCSAGGEADADPEGGCKQSPDYDKDNDYEKDCPDAGYRSGPSGVGLWTTSSLLLCFMLWNLAA